jgi:hypothetical protein
VTGALQGAGLGKRGPDHRRPVLWRDARHRHRTYMPEAVETLVDGDTLTIDLERRRLGVALSDTQVSDRLSRGDRQNRLIEWRLGQICAANGRCLTRSHNGLDQPRRRLFLT